MKLKYYECGNCGNLQVETEFGECSECGYEELVEIKEEEYNTKVNTLNQDNINYVYNKVKELEKEYNSEDSRSKQDIIDCYSDDYILEIWKDEGQYIEETGEGWNTFEDFLIDFIKQNIELE